MRRTLSVAALIVAVGAIAGLAFLMLTPRQSGAEGLMGDMQCVGLQCPCGTGPGQNGPCSGAGNGKLNCPCSDVTSGFPTSGICVSATPPKCKAVSTGGKDGFGLDKVMQILGPLMQQLMKGGQGGGSGSGSGSTGSTPSNSSGCAQYYQVSVPTTDACAYYVPPISESLTGGTTGVGVSDQLLNALGGTASETNTNTNTNTNVSDSLTQTQNTSVTTAATATTTVSTPTVVVPANPANLLPGVRGDIQVLNNGATILAGTRDAASNSEIAGFYGADSFNGQSTGIVGNLCKSRPWSGNFLSNIIPPSFFDGLCSLRGYQVGTPAKVTPTVTIVQSIPQKVTPKPVATTTAPTVPAKVDIWAVPATIPLGSRTSVFWNTQGVTSCTETSPDGSFSQSSLSGGASTVALTGATTFTISCLTPDGSHVTDYVTVNLSI